jgi:hypothetical protein
MNNSIKNILVFTRKLFTFVVFYIFSGLFMTFLLYVTSGILIVFKLNSILDLFSPILTGYNTEYNTFIFRLLLTLFFGLPIGGMLFLEVLIRKIKKISVFRFLKII